MTIRIGIIFAMLALGPAGCDCRGTIGDNGFDPDAAQPDGAGGPCNGQVCPGDFLCRYDTCVPNLGSCAGNDDCPGDSYCDANGDCIPYGVPADTINDPECVRGEPLEGVLPVVQCEWTAPPAGDATEGSTRVYTAPIVADLNLDLDPNRLQPSVILTTWETVDSARTGTLRVFDGRTCEEVFHVGGDDDPDEANRPAYGTQWAVGDLDGDVPGGGHPEIVGMHRTAPGANSVPLNLYAFRINAAGAGGPTAERMWYGRDCDTGTVVEFATNSANYGPGMWDLNDDGIPEILVDTMVFDADGCLLNQYDNFDYITHGRMNTIADADLDGVMELVMGDRLAEWNPVTTEWVDETYFVVDANVHKPGHVAIADLGQYSALPNVPVPNELPEVIVVSAETTTFDPTSSGTIRAQTLDGTIIWGPLPLYHTADTTGGHGGAPTASDFDGDGQVEFAAAANQYYAVYDPDCVAALGGASPAERPGGACVRAAGMDTLPDGILWAQLSQDYSSSGTGSSVFDFNGDGKAEAVYGDECYVRVYDGSTGEVIYSAPASHGTGFELPTIVDVDGDFATEIVVSRSNNNPACPATDPLFPDSGDFVSTGGFAILRDPEDRWAPSRPIWNQHAYSVTNVTDDARIPRTSEMVPNWVTPGLNNFRQNTQGELGVLNIADLTVVLSGIENLCLGQGGVTELNARVCNRGTNPVQDGVTVEFVESTAGIPEGSSLCQVATSRLLTPGACETVTCTGNVTADHNVFVVVDPDGAVADCHPGNNEGAGVLDLCIEVK